MTDKITVRSLQDVIDLLPRLVPYAPAPGSVIVMDSTARPVAVLTPEILAHFVARGPAFLAQQIRVFAHRSVFVFGVEAEGVEYALVLAALRITRSNVMDQSEDLISAQFSGLPTREDYLANGGQKVLDEGYRRAERVATGIEGR